MTPESVSDFLTGYIRSLSEETRSEAKGPRYGFDHIILELAQAKGLVPVRLSFYRQGDGELSKPKKEAEYGVDLAFISEDRSQLWVFVLKDEPLTYRNWEKERFKEDLSRASDQDLTAPEFSLVTEVRIVLAYNKDDDARGIESFDRFVKASPTRIADRAGLVFESWNLTAITEKVKDRLITPSLLPESFFRKFTYLCWQVGDFEHGSPHWHEVLLPDWLEFLKSVLAPPLSERNVRLVSVALVILHSHGKKTATGDLHPSFETGWIDLIEWAIVEICNAAQRVKNKKVLEVVDYVRAGFYLEESLQFYGRNIELLTTEHSLEIGSGPSRDCASSFLGFWHMGRLGLLAMAFAEMAELTQGDSRKACATLLDQVAEWIVGTINANPCCLRPLLDIHHIEIFLVWRALSRSGRWDSALNFFHKIFERMVFRRLGLGSCRVIDYGNSWETLFEFLATDEEPYAGYGRSSYLLLMMLEIALGAPNGRGEELAAAIHRQLILGENADSDRRENLPFKERLDLMGWCHPAHWGQRVLGERVEDGVCLPTVFTHHDSNAFLSQLRKFISNSTKESPPLFPLPVLPSVTVLACLKRASPLPSAFWRELLF